MSGADILQHLAAALGLAFLICGFAGLGVVALVAGTLPFSCGKRIPTHTEDGCEAARTELEEAP